MGAPVGNKYAIGNNGGKPPIYDDPDKLAAECDAYFEYIKGEPDTAVVNEDGSIEPGEQKWLRPPEPATITGLGLYLGFCGRKPLYSYAEKDEFGYIIKKAMYRVEHNYERNLHSDKPTGSIFALKNMGWADKSINEHTGADGSPLQINFIPSNGNDPIPD